MDVILYKPYISMSELPEVDGQQENRIGVQSTEGWGEDSYHVIGSDWLGCWAPAAAWENSKVAVPDLNNNLLPPSYYASNKEKEAGRLLNSVFLMQEICPKLGK